MFVIYGILEAGRASLSTAWFPCFFENRWRPRGSSTGRAFCLCISASWIPESVGISKTCQVRIIFSADSCSSWCGYNYIALLLRPIGASGCPHTHPHLFSLRLLASASLKESVY